jgi:FSR family fosmidomycin resistance protein-like MFS transporter
MTNRRVISLAAYGVLLIVGHGAVDATAGARPALIQLFRANLGLSYTVLGSLVTASSLGGAAAQVIFGLAADATHRVWMAPAGIALVTLGMSAAGFVHGIGSVVLVLGTLAFGSALFHPEALRTMSLLGGPRRVTAMSYFTVGGSVGWALGPALVAVLTGNFGLGAMRWWLVLGLPVAAVLFLAGRRLAHDHAVKETPPALRGAERWREYRTLFALVLLRAAAQTGVLIFFPGYLIEVAGHSQASAAFALSVMLTGGIVTVPIFGRLADRWNRKSMLVLTLSLLTLLIALLPAAGGALLYPELFLVGAMSAGALPVTLVMSQEYLPRRTALGGGLVLAASGLAALVAAPLGVVADAAGLRAAIYMTAGLAAMATIFAARLPKAGRLAEVATMQAAAPAQEELEAAGEKSPATTGWR